MSERAEKASFGIAGLDDVLGGGLTRGRLYLLEGTPGTGKTTASLQFLLSGSRAGERGLYITMSETAAELKETAASHGWSLDAIEIFELVPPESLLDENQQQSLLYSSDLELGEATRHVFEVIRRVAPSRVVLDSLSEIRLLSGSPLRYRRQVLALKHYLSRSDATVVMLDDLSLDAPDNTVHSIAHAVLKLEELAPEFGAQRRRLRVVKYRGQPYRGGYHDFTISTGGVQVYPRLVALEHRTGFVGEPMKSGIDGLDALLGGGIDKGSSTLILGPAGTGKSLLSVQYVLAAIARSERAAMFIFDEELSLLFQRTRLLGLDLEGKRDRGQLFIEQIDAAELSPGEFAHKVRHVVDHYDVRTVVIDSLNGYQSAMPQESSLILHIHELLQYLNRRGASTFLTIAQHGVVGDINAPIEITYLADTVVLLRYFEGLGQVRRAISVIKKRSGSHEETIREYRIGHNGLSVGEPLGNFSGVLTGTPTFIKSGDGPGLLEQEVT
jgi:circadian clock protein KaiC